MDDKLYILGGRNTSDLFLGDEGHRQNIDRDVLVYCESPDDSSSVYPLRDYFEEIWVLEDNSVLKAKVLRTQSTASELRERYEKLEEEYSWLDGKTDWEAATFPVERVTLLANPSQSGMKTPELGRGFVKQLILPTRFFIGRIFTFRNCAVQNRTIRTTPNGV